MMPRLFREAPVNAIWEGSGNVMCLDVLRALGHDARTALVALAEEAADLPGARAALDVIARAAAAEDAEGEARAAVDRLALLAAGTILRAHAPPAVADAFIATRLQGPVHHTYGQGLEGADTRAIVDRAWPG